MGEFLSFRKMITPIIIKILFWIGVVLVVISGVSFIIAGASERSGGGLLVLAGFLLILIGPIIVRINCEILIVVFNINERLAEIKLLYQESMIKK